MWQIRYLMEQSPNGFQFQSTAYGIGIAYPDTKNLPIFPYICVYNDRGVREPYELGSADRKVDYVTVDVFANSDIQRSDLAEIIEDHFHQKHLQMYDFSIKYPDSVGDYTGIPVLGNYFVKETRSQQMEVGEPKYKAEAHHQLLIFTVVLPSI